MKKKKRHITWYVEPLDADTNQALASLLADTNGLAECSAIELRDGKKSPAYLLDSYQPITRLKASKDKFGFKYRVYCQEGPYAPVNEWQFY